jgi:hypothetical protein
MDVGNIDRQANILTEISTAIGKKKQDWVSFD